MRSTWLMVFLMCLFLKTNSYIYRFVPGGINISHHTYLHKYNLFVNPIRSCDQKNITYFNFSPIFLFKSHILFVHRDHCMICLFLTLLVIFLTCLNLKMLLLKLENLMYNYLYHFCVLNVNLRKVNVMISYGRLNIFLSNV